ncbi:hypothetical protein [Streptomyces marianii]|uniref:Uncharacterized protein n=1 Tax=Streptomyces marianii TaxID=1817406 RepID=A0A5R9E6X8_9ACTN|nr:hypothetical protein [Streptomyces marianii]TLQ45790.1 hypothetical protein FEF34_24835 [Streptomyces marianii]
MPTDHYREAEQRARQALPIADPAGALVLAQLAAAHATLALVDATKATDLTVYRASHDSIVFGHYTTREAAREHCETLVRRDVGDAPMLGWIPDDESPDAPEELCTGDVPEGGTGYVVTALTVAATYDPEADE